MGRNNNKLVYLVIGLIPVAVAVICFLNIESVSDRTSSVATEGPIAAQSHARQFSSADGTRDSNSTATTPAEIPTRPACVSHGTVRWEDGEPVVGAEIQIFQTLQSEKVMDSSPHVWVPTGQSTDSRGYYRLPEQEICPLRLAASLDDEGWAEETQAPVDSGTILPFEIQRDLVMHAALSVRGRCEDESGTPIAGARISATSTFLASGDWGRIPRSERSPNYKDFVSRWWAHQAYSDESGEFRFPALSADDWTLLIEADGYENARTTTDNSDENGPPLIVVLRELTCWIVNVVDEEGTAVHGSRVEVGDPNLSVHRLEKLVTDESGRVEVCESAAEGAWIIARADSLVTEWLFNESGDRDVTVTLGKGVRLTGTLLPPVTDGEPCIVSGTGFVGNVKAVNMPTFFTDEHGRFDIDSVPPGAVDLRLLCSGFHPAETNVDLEPGSTVDLGTLHHEPKPESRPPPHRDAWSPFAD